MRANRALRALLPAIAAPLLALGPEIGAKAPAFRLPDQNGRTQTFDTIKGPKGAMLVFYRSADW